MDLIFKLTAILGALAWFPQIINWFINWKQKPQLKIFGDDEAQVSYTTFGCVFNMNFSFLSKKKMSLIENMTITIIDKNKTEYSLAWNWYSETFYELKSPDSIATMGKQQKAISFVAYKDVLTEKLIGFQVNEFREKKKLLLNKINQQLENQKYIGNIDLDSIKKSESYIELMRLYDDSLNWKKGNYSAVCSVYISEMKKPFKYKFRFNLTETDISYFKSNTDLSKKIIETSIFSKDEKIEIYPLWATPMITKE